MNRFSNAEWADIHFTYGRANGNSTLAQRLYRETFQGRQCPAKSTFASSHRKLRERGSFEIRTIDRGVQRNVRTVNMEEEVLERIEQDPTTSSRQVGGETGASHQSVLRVLQEQQLYPYHVQRVQSLSEADYPGRLRFAQWFLEHRLQPGFHERILFTDEATFSRDGIVNIHNNHHWADENPHVIIQCRHQQRFSLNVWVGIVGDNLIGPYFLPPALNGENYRNFLEHELTALLDDVPLLIRNEMYFMHDGAPAHFSRIAREYLNERFPERWIGRGGPVPWAPRSPECNPLDFFLWGYLKTLVYATPINTVQELRERIINSCEVIRNTPGIFERVRQSMVRRMEACVLVNGGHFQQLL